MSLLYGISESNQKIHIANYNKTEKQKIFSPLGKELIAKKGTRVTHHYAHKYKGDRDTWLDPLMTQWHYSYQEICKPENIEKRIEKDNTLHIADIYNNGLVIELQHSPISDEIIKKRENFYINMIWVFDFTSNKNINSGEILFECNNLTKIKLKSTTKNTTAPTFYDAGDTLYEYIGNAENDPKTIWCRPIPRQEFIQKYLKDITIKQYTSQFNSSFHYHSSTEKTEATATINTQSKTITMGYIDRDKYRHNQLKNNFKWIDKRWQTNYESITDINDKITYERNRENEYKILLIKLAEMEYDKIEGIKNSIVQLNEDKNIIALIDRYETNEITRYEILSEIRKIILKFRIHNTKEEQYTYLLRNIEASIRNLKTPFSLKRNENNNLFKEAEMRYEKAKQTHMQKKINEKILQDKTFNNKNAEALIKKISEANKFQFMPFEIIKAITNRINNHNTHHNTEKQPTTEGLNITIKDIKNQEEQALKLEEMRLEETKRRIEHEKQIEKQEIAHRKQIEKMEKIKKENNKKKKNQRSKKTTKDQTKKTGNYMPYSKYKS